MLFRSREKDVGGERENYAQEDQAEERPLDADDPLGPGGSFRCGDRGRRINDGVLGIAHCSGKRLEKALVRKNGMGGKKAGTNQSEDRKKVGFECLHSNEFLFIDNRILLSRFFRVNPYLIFSL